MLRVERISKRFGALQVLNEVSLEICEGEIVGLVGPNGSGKTTLFNIITGLIRPSSGKVFLADKEITNLPSHKIYRLGISRTFQTVRVFLNMSALENIRIAQLHRRNQKLKEDVYIFDLVEKLKEKQVPAKRLTLFERKMLELMMAIVGYPRFILIDEILAGLTEREIKQIIDIIEIVRSKFGAGIFWIEHNIGALMRTCDRIIVLCAGNKIADGKPLEVTNRKEVIDAYLGGVSF